ncbi:MAG: hypothetical protein QM756_02930 [Polyangiaceae bacterium]
MFILLGMIGAYLGKIYEILKNRPRFVIGSEWASRLQRRRPPPGS